VLMFSGVWRPNWDCSKSMIGIKYKAFLNKWFTSGRRGGGSGARFHQSSNNSKRSLGVVIQFGFSIQSEIQGREREEEEEKAIRREQPRRRMSRSLPFFPACRKWKPKGSAAAAVSYLFSILISTTPHHSIN